MEFPDRRHTLRLAAASLATGLAISSGCANAPGAMHTADAADVARDQALEAADVAPYDASGASDAVDATVVSHCPAGWICPATPVFGSRIGAWYSLAYSATTGIPSCPSDAWAASRYRPVRGYYDSADPRAIDQHFAAMRAIGIDFVLLDFTNGIAPDPSVSHIFAAGETLLQRDADPMAPVHMPFALAIGAQLWTYDSLAGQGNEANFVLAHYAAPGGTANPAYVQVEGRPLLVNYNAYDSPTASHPDWDDARFFVGRANPGVSIANTRLARFGSSWWGWANEYPTHLADDVVTVIPGADNTHYCDCPGVTHLDRNGGSNANCGDCDVGCTFAPTRTTSSA